MARLEEIKRRFGSKPKPKANSRKLRSSLVERVLTKRAHEATAAEVSHIEGVVVGSSSMAGTVKRKYTRPGGSFEPCSTNGKRDAILRFGKNTGQKASVLATDDPGYLHWIITRDREQKATGKPGFRSDLLEIMREQLALAGKL